MGELIPEKVKIRRKKRSAVLYSIWRNKDDSLVALDVPADMGAAILGVTIDRFYRMVCESEAGKHERSAFTIRKIKRDKAREESES